jgi:hypothetical protein
VWPEKKLMYCIAVPCTPCSCILSRQISSGQFQQSFFLPSS